MTGWPVLWLCQMLQRLRALEFPWQYVLDGDTVDPPDANSRALLDLVRHHVVPARRPEPALLDGEPLPLTSPASQALWLPEARAGGRRQTLTSCLVRTV